MKELPQYNRLSDGSWNFGNGVISASLSDRSYFNSLPETRKGKTRLILPFVTAILGGIGVACSGGGNKNTVENTRELEKESSGYALPFPEGETWFLTTGPHGDGWSNGIKYAIDIAPPEGGFCPPDGRKFTIANRVVTASASGEVIIKGDDKNRSDPHHSEIRIKDRNGLTQTYIHLDNTEKVKVGNKVRQGYPLGNPSCEYPPGGANTGPHVHVGLMKDGQPIPIDGVKIGGWTIHEGVNGQDGTMTKDREKTRTANKGRFGENSTGIRNDLPNNPNRAVVASPKDPIPPISGNVKGKEVFTATATPPPTTIPTPKPTETPKPTSTVEKPAEKGWSHFTSTRLQIDYPSTWTKDGNDEDGYVALEFNNKNNNAQLFIDALHLEPEYSTLDSFKKFITRQWFGDDTKAYQEIPQVIGGQKAWKIELEPNPEYVYVVTVTKDRAWKFLFVAKEAEDWKTIRTMLASVKFLEPTETPKPAVEKKVSLSKKPDELFKALLTNSISPNILPQGMSSRGASAGTIDETGKALKQVGAVTIKIEDSVSTPARGVPNGGISYSIFPDSSGAKSASELIGTHLQNGRDLNEFPYPAKIYTMQGIFEVSTTVLITYVDSVTVVATLTGAKFIGTNVDLIQPRTISLGHAAIEHLGKVGK